MTEHEELKRDIKRYFAARKMGCDGDDIVIDIRPLCPTCKKRPQYSDSGQCSECLDEQHIALLADTILKVGTRDHAIHVLRIFLKNAYINGQTAERESKRHAKERVTP